MITSENSPALIAGGVSEESKIMAKVKITRSTVAGGFDCKAGQTVELNEDDALTLIRMGKAVPVDSKAKKSDNREADQKVSSRKKS